MILIVNHINIDRDVFNEGEYTLDSIDIVLDNKLIKLS